jgi:hypothetical protein
MFLEQAGKLCHHVSDNQDRSGKTGGQTRNNGFQRFERSGRTADHDNVTLWHGAFLSVREPAKSETEIRGNGKVCGWFEEHRLSSKSRIAR